MSYRDAQRQLVRKMAFLYFLKLQKGKCFRCGGYLDEDTWHLDHKEAWARARHPRSKFWDPDNLAASHGRCNAAAARKKTKGEREKL